MGLGRATAEVRVLDPIPTEGLTMNDLSDLRRQVRAAIERAREDLRTEHGYVPPVFTASEAAEALAADQARSGVEAERATDQAS